MKPKTLLSCCKTLMALIFILGALAGCKKEEIKNNLVTDGYPYFNIRINDQTYLTYGYRHVKYSGVGGGPVLFKYQRQDALGRINEIEITVFDEVEDRFNTPYGPPSYKVLSLGKCKALLFIRKRGDSFLGSYKTLSPHNNDRDFNQIVIEDKTYFIDTSSFSLNIKAEGLIHSNGLIMTEGDYSCKLFQSSNPSVLIPATGSFRMYSN